ncbi:chaperone modulator CbpM [Antarcticibacterium sp. 1MA-6-2]|uniref:chaperone modulator CbpM n=1 Tax=Antarcticibacterium sp. 1MA-6-2 TaxID=2908210 RepID=UPI001F411270|nr:chaperone modulator CbpM [Antarcticibacterium sp. 1MA-6-2]UJH89980.1 chaperone modulator CbpM [Antarcticibacterium sp. 1MA-6-2]
MKLEGLVSTEELCSRYRVERTFISSLYESGLIEVVTIEQKEYVHHDKIRDFEKMHRLHYDLNINLEGMEAVQHLLQQLKKLQKQNLQLRNLSSIYMKKSSR